MSRVRVLIVEDERLLAEELSDRLARLGLDPIGLADTHDTAVATALRTTPDLVLMDVHLKGPGDGIAAAAAIRAALPEVSIIFLTAHSDDQSLERARQVDPIGYLYKPFDERQLHAALALAQGRWRQADDALRDPLTGCWNRRGLASVLVREAARVQRSHGPRGVALVDVDAFKPINDTDGHGAGDQVLVAIARRIEESVRPYDSVARYGGDELLVVIPAAEADALVVVAERIRHAIASAPVICDGTGIGVSASIGVGIAHGAQGLDTLAITKAADASLYAGKRAGRDRVGAAVTAAMAVH